MFRLKVCIAVAALSLLAESAPAEVLGAAAHGFRIQIDSTINAEPHQVYEAFVDIAKWWDKNHTYSGRAENLYFETKPKGWFGEKLPNGGFVRHMQIVYLEPGKEIRMSGGIGPLQELGVAGALTVKLRKAMNHKTNLRPA